VGASTAVPVLHGKGFEPPLTTMQSLLGVTRFSLCPRTGHTQQAPPRLSKCHVVAGQLQRHST